MMHLFIDTSVLLGFYEMSGDSLAELEKLVTVLRSRSAVLWLPDQVHREFWKNREASVIKAIKEFDLTNVIPAAPVLIREHDRFTELQKRVSEVASLKEEIVSAVRRQIVEENTQADTSLRRLWEHAKKIDTDNIFETARRRALRRLPPGKTDDLGDRLNWVALLRNLPRNAELHVISVDGDYESEAVKGTIRRYLEWEWKKENGGSATLWKRLSQYIAAHFRDAVNAADIERSIAAKNLVEASNFSQTHAAIAILNQFERFSAPQAEIIATAFVNNSQVRWIATDSDVKEFGLKFLRVNGDQLSAELKEQLRQILEKQSPM
jgi:hypothetical protein